MKVSVLIVVSLVLALGAGFGGGFAAVAIHDSFSSAITGQVPTIDDFSLIRSTIESGQFVSDSFYLNASESGTPYQAGFQVVLINGTHVFTLASGSFFGSLNYTPVSLAAVFFYGDLGPGNYTLVATVMHGNLGNSADAHLEVLPSISVDISGPHEVNDSSGPAAVTYSASVTGGMGPYSYDWSIMYVNGPNPQNYVIGQAHGSTFDVTFSVNTSNSYYGTNQTFVIGLTVTDSLGYSFSYAD